MLLSVDDETRFEAERAGSVHGAALLVGLPDGLESRGARRRPPVRVGLVSLLRLLLPAGAAGPSSRAPRRTRPAHALACRGTSAACAALLLFLGALFIASPSLAQSAGIQVSPTSVVFGSAENRAFYRVRLASQPSASVSVIAEADTTREATIDGAGADRRLTLSFTTATWKDWQTVWLTRGGTGTSTGTTSISHEASSTDSNYSGLVGPPVTVTHDDNVSRSETAQLEFSVEGVTLASESASGSYSVRLKDNPGGSGNVVTVTTNSRNVAGLSVTPRTLTFNGGSSGNWNTYTAVTVEATTVDSDSLDDSFLIDHSVSGIPLQTRGGTMPVIVVDTVTAGLEFRPARVTVYDNAPASYELRLKTPPTRDVSVGGTIGKAGIVTTRVSGASSATFTRTFTSSDWDAWQEVELHHEADGTTSIAHATTSQDTFYSGLSGSVAVTAAYFPEPRATLEVSSTSVEEGDDLTVTVKLVAGDAPTAATEFPLVYTNGSAEAADYTAVDSIEVAANERTASATVAIADDNVYEAGGETFTVALGTLPDGIRAPGPGESSSHEVTIAASDKPTVSISGSSAALEEGDGRDLQIVASNPLEARFAVALSVSQEGGHIADEDDDDPVGLQLTSVQLQTNGRVLLPIEPTLLASDDPDGSVTIELETGSDYTLGDPSTITIPILDTHPTTVSLSAPAGAVAEAEGTRTVTIALGRGLVDGESLSLPLAVGGTAVLGTDYTLSAPETLPAGVAYATLGTAPTVTFTGGSAPSATSATLVLTATSDAVDETDETVTIGLPELDEDSGTGLSGGASGSGSVSLSITDDDAMPVVSIAGPSDGLTEGDTAAYTVTVAGASARALDIGLTVSQAGSFVASGDTGTKSLALASGTGTLTYSVVTVDDEADEADGSVTVRLNAGSGYTVDGDASAATVAVADDDPTTVVLSAPAGDISETNGSKVVTLTLGRGLVAGEALSLPLTVAGQAKLGTDYVLSAPETAPTGVTYATLGTAPTVTFTGAATPSATAATLTLSATSDVLDEGASETVSIGLPTLNENSGSGLEGGASGSGSVGFAITDDDAAPVVSLARVGTGAIVEGSSATFTVSAPNPSARDLSIGLEVSQDGSFLAAASVGEDSLELSSGDTSLSYTLASASDLIDEADGSFTVTLATPGTDAGYTLGSARSVTVAVNDDDPTGVALDVPGAAISETNGTKTLTVTLGRALVTGESLPVVVRFAGSATFGTDYTVSAPDPVPSGVAYGTPGASTTITFTGGSGSSASATLVLSATGDSINEGASESVRVSLAPLTAASGTGLRGGARGSGGGSFQITDDDSGAVMSIAGGAAVVEGGTARFTVTSSLASATATTVNLSVTATGDVVLSSATGTKSVIVPAGERTATYSVATRSDTVDEVGGTVSVAIASGTGYSISGTQGSASVAVSDDDPTTVALAASDTTATEGSAIETAAFTVTLGRALASGESLVVPLAVTGVAANEYSLTLTRATGVSLAANALTFAGGTGAARVASIAFRALSETDAGDLANEAVSIAIPASSATGTPRMTATGLAGGATGSGSVNIAITDNGVAAGGVTLSLASLTVAEYGSATYTVVLNTDPGATVTVTPSSDNSEVTLAPKTLEFTHGASGNWNTPQTVTVSAAGDGDTANDSATVSHAVSGYGGVTASNVSVTVTDAGHGFSVVPTSLTVEAGQTATYRVRTLSLPGWQIRFRATSGDTEVATVPGRRLSFAASDWETGFEVTVTGLAAGTATVTHVNRTVSAATVYGQDGALTIPPVSVTVAASSAPLIGIAAGSASVTEGNGAAFTVSSSMAAPEGGLTVTLTAAETGDFVDGTLPASVTIAEDATEATVTVATDDDNADERNGGLTLSVAAGTEYRLRPGQSSAGVVLLDNDATGVSLSGSGNIAETAGEKSVTVTLSRQLEAGEGLTVPLSFGGGATFGTDYRLAAPATLPAGVGYLNLATATPSVTFTGGAASSATAAVRIVARSDPAAEGDETVTVGLGTLDATSGTNLGGGASGSGTASFTITDDDGGGPTVSIVAGAGIDEGGTASFTVRASPAPDADLKVNLNVGQAGSFVAAANLGAKSVTVSANAATASFTVATAGDDVDEPDGSVSVTVTSGTDYTVSSTAATAGVTVKDDDVTKATLSAPAGNIDENLGSKEITVTLGRSLATGESLDVALSFGGAAVFGTDYTLAGPAQNPSGVTYANLSSDDLAAKPPTVTFTGGAGASATATLTLTATSDSAEEPSETVTVGIARVTPTGLSGGASGSGSRSFSIVDDDDPSLPTVGVTAGSDIAESASASFQLSVSPSTHPALTVYYTVTQSGEWLSSANLGAGKSVSVQANAGSASISIPVEDDSADEAKGSVTVTLSARSTYSISSTQGRASLAVDDNDATVATVSSQPGDIPEKGGKKIVNVSLGRALVTGESLQVPLSFGGAAGFGTDYTLEGPDKNPAGVSYANLATANPTTTPPSITFTGGAKSSASAPLTVVASDDIADEGASETVTVGPGTLTASSGTGLSGGARGAGTARFAITDDDGTPAISVAGGTAVTEGGTATFTLTANPAPKGNITVALVVSQDGDFVVAASLGADKSVAFATGEKSKTYMVATSGDNADEAPGSVSVRVATGNGYVPATGADRASVDVADDDPTAVTLSLSDSGATENLATDTAGISVALNRALVEGERLIVPLSFTGGTLGTDFTLALSAKADGVAFDTKAGFVTFTAGGSAATVLLTALSDADETDDTVTVGLGMLTATGLGGGASGSRTGDGEITVTDAGPQPAVDVDTTSVAANEAGTASYRVKLHTDPGRAVTVTPVSGEPGRLDVSGPLSFDSTDWEDWQTVTLDALPDGDIADNDVSVTHDVSGYGDVASGPTVTVSVVDRGRGVEVVPATLSTSEGQSASYRLRLYSRPSTHVTVTPESGSPATATAGAAVTIAPTTWNVFRTVQVSGIESGSAAISHAVTSSDASYEGITAPAVSVTVNPSAGVRASPASISPVEYGADATYTVELKTDPGTGATVRVTPATTSSKISISPAEAVFTQATWNRPQKFTVSASPDNDESDETAVITHSVTGYGSVASGPRVDVSVEDAGARFLASVDSLTLDEAESGSFELFATATPASRVELSAQVSSGLNLGFSGPAQFPVFTSTRLRFTVAVVAGTASAGTVTFASLGRPLPEQFRDAPLPSVQVTIEAADRVNVTPRRLALKEGGADGSYAVSLNSDPGGGNTVTVTPSSPDTGAVTVSGGPLTFTSANWNEARAVTVSPVDDDDAAHESVTIANAVSGYPGVTGAPGVVVAVDDDEAVPELSISAGTSPVTEGGEASFTVTADPAPASALTVRLSLAQAGAYVDSDDLALTSVTIAADETTETFTVDTDDDAADEAAGSLTATLTADAAYTIASAPDNAATVAIRDDDPTGVVLGVPAGNVDETGGSKTLTVTLGRALVSGEVLPVEVKFSGTATRGTDYSLVAPDPVPSGLAFALGGATPTVTFTGPSPASASFSLEATDDEDDEGDSESVSVSLGTLNASSGTNLHGGASGSGTGAFVIADDDDPPVPEVSIVPAAATPVTEGAAAGFTVSAAPAPDADLVVRLNVSATGAFVAADELGPESVTIKADEASATFQVATQGDKTDEPGGSVTVAVTANSAYTVSNTAASATAAVADDDPTAVTLAASDSEATEGESTQTAGFTVTLGRALVAGEKLTVPLAIAGGVSGSDYSLALTAATGIAFASGTNTLTFTGGAGAKTVATLTLTALDDTDAIDEQLRVSLGTIVATGLGGGASGSGSATISLIDDESSIPTIGVEGGDAVEEGTTMEFTVRSSRRADDALTVSLTVTQRGSYVRPGNDGAMQVVIQPGQSTATLRVLTDTRIQDEPDGVVTATVNANAAYKVSRASGSADIAVEDADATEVTLRVPDATASEGSSTATARIEVEVGRILIPGERIVVPLTFAGGAAGSDFSLALAESSSDDVAFASSTSTLTYTGSSAFEIGSTTAILTVTAIEDADATDERVTVGLGTVTDSGIGGGTRKRTSGSVVIAITDNDETPQGPVVSVAGGDGVTEGTGAGFTVTATPAPAADLTVNLGVTQAGAFVAAGDLGNDKSVTIEGGASSATYSVPTEGDDADEPGGSVTVTVLAGTDYSVSSSAASDDVAVADDDATGVTLQVTDASTTEGDASDTAALTVTLGRALVTGESLTAVLTFAGGTAGTDFDLALATATGIAFAPTTSTLTFTGGTEAARVATLTLTAAADDDIEDETVTVSLGTLTPTGLGGGVSGSRTGDGEIAIADAGAPVPVVSVAGGDGVTEGTGAGFTVTATPAPAADLTVNLGVTQAGAFVAAGDLGNDKSVTIEGGASSATYSVPTEGDDADEPGGSVTVTVLAGADYSVSSSAASDDVAVADDDATGVTLQVTDASATEGDASDTAALTVTLGRALVTGESLTAVLTFAGGTAGTDFTLALATATGIAFAPTTSTLTFTGGTEAARVATLTLTAAADDDIEDETVTVSLGTLTPTGLGGGVSGSRTGDGEIAIADAGAPVPVVSVAGGDGVTEGTGAGFTVTATPAPAADLTVNLGVTQAGAFVAAGDLGNDKSVTIEGGASSATYSVPTEGDDADEPGGSVTVTVLAGTDYSVSSSAASDDVAVADDDATGVTLQVTDASATEGDASDTAEITVTLGRALAAGEGLTVTLAFAGAAYGQDFTLAHGAAAGIGFSAATRTLAFSGGAGAARVATLTLTPVADADGDDETVTVSLGTLTPTGLGGGVSGSRAGDGEVAIADAGIQGAVLIAGSPVSLAEAGPPGSYTVQLATDPGAGAVVTVTPISTDAGAATVSGPLTFDSSNWNVPQAIEAAPVADGDIDGETVAVVHAVEGYPGVTGAPDATVEVTDRGRGVTIEPTSLTMNAGGSARYSAVLHSRPEDTVTVAAASDDPGTATVSGALTFAPSAWDVPQVFTATGVDGGSTSIRHRVDSADAGYAAIAPTAVSVTVAAVPRVVLSGTSLAVSERGAGGSYTVVLGTNPGGSVRVAATADDPGAVTVSGPLSFDERNWSTPQRVTVSARIDGDTANERVRISHAVTGYAGAATPPDVTVRVTDFGHAILVEPTRVSAFVGETASYTVTVTGAPASPVNLSLSSGSDRVATVDGRIVLTASDANAPVTVRVTGVGVGQTTISHRAASSDPNYGAVSVPQVTVSVAPAAGVRIAPAALSLSEGGGDGSYGVVLGTDPGTAVTVTPASGDPGAATVSGALTFDASNWNEPQSVTVSPVDDADVDDESLTVTHRVTGYPGVTGAPDVAVTVLDDDRVPTVSVSPIADVAEGGNAGFRVSAAPAPQADLEIALGLSAEGDFAADLAGSATVTIGAGAEFANYTLETTDDRLDEPDGSLTAALAAGDGYLVAPAPGDTATLNVSDNDPTTATLSASPASVRDIAEAGGSVTLTLALNRALQAGESLPVALALGGAAAPGADYALTAPDPAPPGVTYSGLAGAAPRILFTGGAGSSATATLTLAALDDGLDEDDKESLLVALAGLDSTSGTGLGGGAVGVGSLRFDILDDDDPALLPAVSVSAGPNVVEGTQAVFTVAATPAPEAALTVALGVSATGDFAAAGSLGDRTVTIPVGGTATYSVATVDDGTEEADGTVTVSVAAGEGYTVGEPSSAAVAVSDDDAVLPRVTVTPGTSPVTEGAAASFTVSARPAPDTELTVALDVSATGDFAAAGSLGDRTVTVPVGGTATYSVATVDDGTEEADGTVTVSVAAGEGYTVGEPSSAAVAVSDDDAVPPEVTVAGGSTTVTDGGRLDGDRGGGGELHGERAPGAGRGPDGDPGRGRRRGR